MDHASRGETDDSSGLLPEVTQRLSPIHREQVLNRIWGFAPPNLKQTTKFRAFFEHYETLVAEQGILTEPDGGIRTHNDVLCFIDLLKTNCALTSMDLKTALQHSKLSGLPLSLTVTVNEKASRDQSSNVRPQIDPKVIDAGLATAAKLVFALNLNLNPSRILVGQSDVVWEEGKSLESLIGETFPVHGFSDEPTTPMKPSKLRARYLESHAEIQIVWTRHLPDHLKLDVGPHTKILRVFELVSLLEMMYEAMGKKAFDLSLQDSLKLGCYTPKFLYETLRTILLLFPTQDRQWLEKKINPPTRWFTLGRTPHRQLDKRLSAPFKSLHRETTTTYDRPLTTRRELFVRYPHWAVRLHTLYAEAEDPAPVSWLGKWAERRKAARHTFWLTFIAFLVAILFGILASTLAALQIWISYCQWQEDASSVCRPHGQRPSSVPNVR